MICAMRQTEIEAGGMQPEESKPAEKSLERVEKEWGGYTYEELKFQLLLTRTRIELNKSMMMAQSQSMMQKKAKSASMVSRMLGALDYFDYGVMAYKVVRRLYKMFRR